MVRMEKTLAAYGIKPKKAKFEQKFRFSVDKDKLNKYSDLERIFELQRVENEAAKSIQQSYRRSRVLLPWRRAVAAEKSLVQIQRIVRGAITRKWVADWYNKRNTIVIGWQAHSRRYTININTRRQLKLELESCIRIQTFARMVLGRWKARRILTNICAARIQCLWRGCVCRSKADRKWLQHTVVSIQKIVRSDLAKKKMKSEGHERNMAAEKIQRTFRNFTSLGRMRYLMAEREKNYRLDSIASLTAEEEHCQVVMSKLMERMVKNNIKGKAEAALRSLYAYQEKVYAKENDLIEIRRQMDILSPRTREQGWMEELLKNEKQMMEDLMKMKIHTLFDVKNQVDVNDELLEQQVELLEFWAVIRDKVAHWREQEYDDRRHWNYFNDIIKRRKEKKMAVAEEKRRWQVLYYTSDGKPDKRRRPGQPWDPTVYAGPDKMTYSAMNHVNLLAHTKKKDESLMPGEPGAVANAVDGISLQAYLEQNNTYEQLLQPVIDILSKYSGGNPTDMEHKDAKQMGWGPIGAQLAPALRGIGALSPLPEEKPVEVESPKQRIRRKLAEMKAGGYAEDERDDLSVLTGDASYLSIQNGPPQSCSVSQVGVGGVGGGVMVPMRTTRSIHSPPQSRGTTPQSPADSGRSPKALALALALPQAPSLKIDANKLKQDLKMAVRASRAPPPNRTSSKAVISSAAPAVGDPRHVPQAAIERSFSKGSSYIPYTNLSMPRWGRDQKNHRDRDKQGRLEQGQGQNQASEPDEWWDSGDSKVGGGDKGDKGDEGDEGDVWMIKGLDNALENASGEENGQEKEEKEEKEEKKKEEEEEEYDSEEDRLLEAMRVAQEMAQKKRAMQRRREKKIANRASSAIPWTLLDQLDGEKKRFETWKAHVELNSKIG